MSAVEEISIGELTERPETWNPAAYPSDEPFEYIDIASVDNIQKRIISTSKVTRQDAPSRARQKLRLGDIIVSTVRPNLNAIALISQELDGATGSTGFSVLRPVR